MGLNSLWLIGSALLLMLFTGFAIMQKSVQLAKVKKKDRVFKRTIVTILVGFFAFASLGIFVMFGLTSWNGQSDGLPPLFLIFQSLLCVSTVIIATAASFGRLPARIYIYLALFISVFLYPFLGRLLWHNTLNLQSGIQSAGWLADMGFRDIAGATLIHSVAGWVALATLIMFGLRKQGVADLKHKLGLRILSTLFISAGMFTIIAVMASLHVSNFNNVFADAIVAKALSNALYASFTSLVVAVLASLIRFRRLHVRIVTSAFIAGLVAISGSAFAVDTIPAVIIGAIAAVLMMVTASILESLNISDALNIVPTHLVAGIWGSIAVGVFANTELLGSQLSSTEQLAVQIMGVTFYGLVSFLPTCIFLWLLAKLNLLGIDFKSDKERNVQKQKASTLFTTLEEEARARKTTFRENVKATQALSVLTSYDAGYNPNTQNVPVAKSKKQLQTNFHTGIIMTDKESSLSKANDAGTGLKKTAPGVKAKGVKARQTGRKTRSGTATTSTYAGTSTQASLKSRTRSTRTGQVTDSGRHTRSTQTPLAAIAEHQPGFQKRYPSKDIQQFIELLEDGVKATKPANYTTSLVLSKLSSLRTSSLASETVKEKAEKVTGSDVFGMQLFSTALASTLTHAEHFQGMITAQFINDMYFASALHRIATIGIDEDLLFDIGDFDGQDYADFEQQSSLPLTLIKDVSGNAKKSIRSQSLVQMFTDITKSHLERWDGAGQPNSQKGEDIPLAARIINLVDSYIALRMKPTKLLSHPSASQFILMNSMKQFDPVIVHHFFRINELFEEGYADNFAYLMKGRYSPPTVERMAKHDLTNEEGEVINPQNTMELLMDM